MSLETFASPGLRWGLLLVDHPGATHEFKLCKGTDIGFPVEFGGNANFCVCTITFPPGPNGEQHAPVTASKEAKAKGQSDEWVVICTKTLGRALKKAGYPDDMEDLRNLVLWRRRNAEVMAIAGGQPLALESGPTPGSIHEASAAVEKTLIQEARRTVPAEDEIDETIMEAEIVPDDDGEADDYFDQILEEVNALSGSERQALREFLASRSIPAQSHEWTDEDLQEIREWLDSGSE